MMAKKKNVKSKQKKQTSDKPPSPKKEIKLTLEDVVCPICLSIMIEPVTMPCEHSLCSPCFKNSVQQAALACPLCRKRISVWVRRATKDAKLVNDNLWKYIQDNFSQKIEARLKGKEDRDIEMLLTPRSPNVSTPGEIRKEYERELASHEAEKNARQKAELEASVEIIKKLQEEEKKKAEIDDLCGKDLELAKKLREEQMAENLIRRRSTKKIMNFSPIVSSQKGPMYSFLESTPKSSHIAGPSNIPQDSCHIKSEQITNLSAKSSKALGDITSSQNSESEIEDNGCDRKAEHSSSKGKENISENPEHAFVTPTFNRSSSIAIHQEMIKNESMCDSSNMALRLSTSNELFDSTADFSMKDLKHIPGKGETAEPPEDSSSSPNNDGSASLLENVSDMSYESNDKEMHTDRVNIEQTETSNEPSHLANVDSAKLLTNLSDMDLESEEWKELVREQELLEQRLQQEKEDRKLALQLSRDMKSINRQKGTEGEYSLRNSLGANSKDTKSVPKRTNSKRPRSPNQSTIIESFAKRRKLQ